MSTRLVGAAKKQEAQRMLKQPRVLVLFFMTGCPHCEANESAWKDAKAKAGKDVKVVEVEASATPDDAGVNGFPTMKYEEKEISGQRESGDQILDELKVPKKSKKGGSLRRRGYTNRRTRNRRNIKLRHRTLRNHVPLV